MDKRKPAGGLGRILVRALLATTPPVIGAFAATPVMAQGTRGYDIPAGPLAAALGRFIESSGVAVVYDAALTQGIASSGVNGAFGPAEALSRMLAGSGLTYRQTGPRSFTIERAPQTTGGAITLGPVRVEGDAGSAGAPGMPFREETATAPVGHYAARLTSTGTKGEVALVEVPQSISIITSEQIAAIRPQSIEDALAYTSSVGITEGFGRSGQEFVIRGFITNSTSGGVLRDGMRAFASLYDGQLEPFGLERIEVLKGASSVLYGAAAPGGVVNSVSKRPTNTPFGEVAFDVGNFARRQATLDASDAFGSGDVLWRLTALGRDSKSFLDDVDDDRIHVAPALSWRPSTATELTILSNYQYSRSAYYYALPLQGTIAVNPNGPIARATTVADARHDRFVENSYSAGYVFKHTMPSGLLVDSKVRYVRSRTRNDYTNDDGFIDSESGRISRSMALQRTASRVFTFDHSIGYEVAAGRVSNNIVVGTDFSRQAFTNDAATAALNAMDLFRAKQPSALGAVTPLLWGFDTVQRRIGVYAEDRLKIDEKWVLTAGLRQEWFRTGEQAESLAVNPIVYSRDKALTGRIGLVRLFGNGLAPYVSLSQSFEPQVGRSRTGERFDPTKGQQYEVGLRYQPEGRDLLLSAAIYQLTRTNVLTPDSVQPLLFSVQTGEVRARGVEVEAKGNITPRFAIIGAYAYTDAKITKSNKPEEIGKRNPNTARHQASLWADYRVPDPVEGLSIGLGVRHVESALARFLSATRPAYTVFDARMGIDRGPWRLAVNARNLFDRTYVASCTYGCFYGEARQLIASAGYRW